VRVDGKYCSGEGQRRFAESGQEVTIRDALESFPGATSRGSAPRIKEHVNTYLLKAGWAIEPRLDPQFDLSINASHRSGVGLQIQLGNVARAFYDLLKLNAAYHQSNISVGVLVVPTAKLSKILGSNLASFERITREHEVLFASGLPLPLVVLGLE